MFDQSPEKMRASRAYPMRVAPFLKMQRWGLRTRRMEQSA